MSHEPVDLLIIMLGTNDTKERFGSSSACIALGLKRLIAKAYATTDCWRNQKAQYPDRHPQEHRQRIRGNRSGRYHGKGLRGKSAALGAEYQKIAQLMNCHYFDANTVVKENNHIDYMHLTAEGHIALAKALAKKIPSILA